MKRVLDHYEQQSDDEAVAEDEAAYESTTHTAMEVPVDLVPAVRELLAKRRAITPMRSLSGTSSATRIWLVIPALLLTGWLSAQSSWPTKGWPTSTPGAEGLDAKILGAFDADLAGGKYGYVDSMLVIRHGKVVLDRTYKNDYDKIYAKEAAEPGPLNANDPTGPYNYFNPWWHPFYHRGDLHTMQSVTKSVTSIVIGIATARKEFPALDTPVLSFFDASKVANVDDRKRRMTLRHLLTMSSGLDWDEDLPYADPKNDSSRMEATFDWVRYTIDRPMKQEPGTTFKYSSGVTQLLSHIFHVATHQDIEDARTATSSRRSASIATLEALADRPGRHRRRTLPPHAT